MTVFLRNILKILIFIGQPFYLLIENLLSLIDKTFAVNFKSELLEDKEKLVKLITIPVVETDGVLGQLQFPEISFEIKRVYYIYGVSVGAVRGAHTHKETIQVLFCIQGDIKIALDNGKDKETVLLNKSNVGILLEPGVWHEMQDFKKDTVLLVLASQQYNPQDYVRSYDDFLKYYGGK